MKTILIIISIIMLTSVGYAEQVDLSVETSSVYMFVAMVYESDEGELIDSTDLEMTEGLTETMLEMDNGNYLVIQVAPILLEPDGYEEVITVWVTTENSRLIFISSGDMTIAYTL